jgi:hypothetical protein
MVVLNPKVKPFLFVAASVAVAIGVLALSRSTTGLRRQLAAQRDHSGEVESLRREQERLRALKGLADEQARLKAEAAAHEAALARTHANGFTDGKWIEPGALKNRGCATPACTIESMLWAAAGGDAVTLGNMLHFDNAARAKIDEIFARLSADARTRYVSAAQLVAAFTVAAIPVGNAKLISQYQTAPDWTEVTVWITLPDYRPIDSSTGPPRPLDDLIGPTWARGQKNRVNHSLRRIDGAWRLVVPVSALAKIEQEIGGK